MIGIIGDLHLSEYLPYHEYVKDGRVAEKQAIFDTIIEKTKNCDAIVMMGDNFHMKNNPSSVIKNFISFIERFEDKDVFIIAGNHEKFGNSKSAIDFLSEVKNKKWHIISNEIAEYAINEVPCKFIPYFTNAELGVKDYNEATKKIYKQLQGDESKYLFVHHTISDMFVNEKMSTNMMHEIVLSKEKLSKTYDLIIAGHIHTYQAEDKVMITGSIFTREVEETEKYIQILDENTGKVNLVPLPVRPIYKLENPSVQKADNLQKNSIVKAIFTDEEKKHTVDNIRDVLRQYDAHIIVEQYPKKRKKRIIQKDILSMSIEETLKIYAQERKVDYKKLKKAFDLIAHG